MQQRYFFRISIHFYNKWWVTKCCLIFPLWLVTLSHNKHWHFPSDSLMNLSLRSHGKWLASRWRFPSVLSLECFPHSLHSKTPAMFLWRWMVASSSNPEITNNIKTRILDSIPEFIVYDISSYGCTTHTWSSKTCHKLHNYVRRTGGGELPRGFWPLIYHYRIFHIVHMCNRSQTFLCTVPSFSRTQQRPYLEKNRAYFLWWR